MNADDFVGGHSILALERFMDETRHMIILMSCHGNLLWVKRANG